MAPVHSSLPDISMTQLQYLVAVQESPTWASAAAARGVSQSALSQGLAALQRRLGIELFSWNGRRRVPAASTAEVTEHARRIRAAKLLLRSRTAGANDRRYDESCRSRQDSLGFRLPAHRFKPRCTAPDTRIRSNLGSTTRAGRHGRQCCRIVPTRWVGSCW